jgi:hypothetical protein
MNLNITLVIFLIFTIFIVYYSITRIFSLNNKDKYDTNKIFKTIVKSATQSTTTSTETFSNNYEPLSLDDRIRELENKNLFNDNDYFNLFVSIFPIDEQQQKYKELSIVKDEIMNLLYNNYLFIFNENIPYIVGEIFLVRFLANLKNDDGSTVHTKEIDNKLYLMRRTSEYLDGNSKIIDITGIDEWDGTMPTKSTINTTTNAINTTTNAINTSSNKISINVTKFLNHDNLMDNNWVNIKQSIKMNRKYLIKEKENLKDILTKNLDDYYKFIMDGINLKSSTQANATNS